MQVIDTTDGMSEEDSMRWFRANASRFTAKPSPADSHWLSRQKFASHCQLKDPSTTGIPLNFKLEKAVFCRKIG